jgi:hypothetical protein
MAERNFWQDKWLRDQYNQRNPGQRDHPDEKTMPKKEDAQIAPNPDDVLRVMLRTPPTPHGAVPKDGKKTATRKKKPTK